MNLGAADRLSEKYSGILIPAGVGSDELAKKYAGKLAGTGASRPSATFGRHPRGPEGTNLPRTIDTTTAQQEAEYAMGKLRPALEAPEQVREAIEAAPSAMFPYGGLGKRLTSSGAKALVGTATLPAQIVATGVEEGPVGLGKMAVGMTGIPSVIEDIRHPKEFAKRFVEDPIGEAMGPLAALGTVAGGVKLAGKLRGKALPAAELPRDVQETVLPPPPSIDQIMIADHQAGRIGDAALEQHFGKERAYEIRNGIGIEPPPPPEPALLPEQQPGVRQGLEKQVYQDLEAQGIGGRKSKTMQTRSQFTNEIAAELDVPGEKEPVPGFVTEQQPVETRGTEAGAMGMPVKRVAPAEFLGLQEMPGGKPPVELYNLTEDLPGHTKGSTVSRQTLEKAGFTVSRETAKPRDFYREATEPTPEQIARRVKPEHGFTPEDAAQIIREEKRKGAFERAKRVMEEIGATPREAAQLIGEQYTKLSVLPRAEAAAEARTMLKGIREELATGVYGTPGRAEPIPEPEPLSAPEQTGPRTAPATEPISPHDVRRFLETRLNVPIRRRMFRGAGTKFLGVFKPGPEVIRTFKTNDLPTIAHEAGHYLDKKLGLRQGGLNPAMKSELVAAGKRIYPKPPKNGWASEGVAEFHNFLLTDPARAAKDFPAYYGEYMKRIRQHPEMWDALQEARSMIEKMEAQPASASVLAHMSIGKERARPMSMQRVIAEIHDSMTALKPWGRSYDLAMNFTNWAAIADEMLTKRMIDAGGKTVGPSLGDTLKPVRGHLDDLRVLLTARRAVELGKRGIETGIDPKIAAHAAAEVQSLPHGPALVKAADAAVQWNNQLRDYLVERGIVPAEAAAAMDKVSQQYVPFYREAEGPELFPRRPGQKRGFNEMWNPIKRMRGGEGQIVDPLESMVGNAMAFVRRAEANRVIREVADAAAKIEGSGRAVESVPLSMQALKFPLEDFKNSLEKLGVDLKGIPDEQLASLAITFRPSIAATLRKGAIGYLDHAGNPRALIIGDRDLHAALTALDVKDPGWVVRLLAYPKRTLQYGATYGNAAFSLVNFLFRDQIPAYIRSEHGLKPFIDPTKALVDIIRDTDQWKDYRVSGAHGGTLAGQTMRSGGKLLREVLKGETIPADATGFANYLRRLGAKIGAVNPEKAIRKLNDAMEAATRFAESKRAEAQGADRIARARAAQEVTNNYNRIGNSMRAVNMMTAFYNAAWQAVGADIAAFRKHPARYTFRAGVSIAMPTAILYAVNRKDPEYWKLPQWQRDYFWMVPLGSGERHYWIPIPKAHLPGMVFGTALERSLKALETKDPKALEGFLGAVASQGLPGTEGVPTPTALTVPYELWANKSTWTGRPIVPFGKDRLVPEQQFGPNVGPTAKAIGNVAGVSPGKIEHGVRGFAGGVGLGTMRLADIVGRATGLYPKGAEETTEPYAPESFPGVRRFITRRPPGQGDVDESVYAEIRKGETLLASWRDLVRSGTEADRKAFQRRYGAQLREYISKKKELDKKAKEEKTKNEPITLQDVKRSLEAR